MKGHYSFSVEKIQGFPTETELLNIDKENEKILKASAVCQEPVELEEVDHGNIGLELRRQDLKISLLLDLVGELLIRQNGLPPVEHIQLTATDIEFSNEICKVDAGDRVKASLFLLPAFPRALQLYGDVSNSEREDCSIIKLHGVSAAVQDQIEKIIFTHHRRSIAQEHAGSRTSAR